MVTDRVPTHGGHAKTDTFCPLSCAYFRLEVGGIYPELANTIVASQPPPLR